MKTPEDPDTIGLSIAKALRLFDGLLEPCQWHGQRFDSPEVVQPLVFRRLDGESVLGWMDRIGLTVPFFLVLRREARQAGDPGSTRFTFLYSSVGP